MQSQLGNWMIALGIDWTMPSDASEVRSRKKKHTQQSDHARDSFVLMSSETGQRWLGFHAPVVGKVYAGALLVAMVKPNAVVYQPLSESSAWVCALQDGMPVVGYDKVLPAGEGRNTAIEWSSMFPQAEMIGELQGAQSSVAEIFAVLDEGLDSKAIQKKQIAGALLNANNLPWGRIFLYAGVVVAAAVLAYGATWYMEVRKAQREGQLSLEDATRKAIASALDQTRQAAQRQAAQEAFRAQVEAARIAQQERFAPVAFWAAMSAVRRAIGVSVRGYKPQSFDCSPQACRVTWLGDGRFVNAVDKLRLPNVERSLSFDAAANSVFPMAIPQVILPIARSQSADELRFLIQSNFALHVKGFTVEAAQSQSVTAPKGTSLPPVEVAQVGRWHVQLHGSTVLLDAEALLQMMHAWPMRVTNIKYEPGPNSVALDGEFIFMTEQKG